MSASIDDVIATAATHLLMVKRHTPDQVADYLVRMARWSEAKAAITHQYEPGVSAQGHDICRHGWENRTACRLPRDHEVHQVFAAP